ncbi:glucose-6-phosphate isomerase [Pseudofulvimonas gallinarii]|uniref:Glucose-6-phosphate isomerase n=1 Tax=Pseudofulvimonas gallinarii TaxID=634155 RepID=A0A4R3LKD8_9GAMM|nr:glucose-6-phosphate isomerase [Pseudofulvimonas gallinarii]THD12018.1 glucose-6-phosphate isomerase [Pseudofulvimonas gallinarii]
MGRLAENRGSPGNDAVSTEFDSSVLASHAARLAGVRLVGLFEQEPTRFARFSRRLGPLLVDVSKQAIDGDAWQALLQHAASCAVPLRRDALFAGEPVNASEQRPALHMALRAARDDEGTPAWCEARDQAQACLERMAALVDAVRKAPGVIGLPKITDVVSVGIGGSDFGPRLACAALAGQGGSGPAVHFLANVDGGRLDELMRRLDPEHTLVVLVSKSFGTQETLLNGGVLYEWLCRALGSEQAHRRLFAVTANAEAARAAFALDDARILPMWDFVGGRYSLWSAVGFPVALALGMDGFRRLLAGARQVDRHFREAPLEENLPVWLALVSWWNRAWLGRASHCIVPYDDRLEGLPGYLQQLEMESNGKRVRSDGEPVALPTVPVVWGSVGSNAQHAYFQALHQGTDVVPVDFIGVVKPDHALDENHRALLANLLAQSAALMRGRDEAATWATLAGVADPALRRSLAAQKAFPGNRPSTTILLDRLDPESLGALLALYEHKTFVHATLCGINPFDQWGVELGKSLASRIEPGLRGETAVVPDASTAGLLAHIRALRKAAPEA